MNAEPWLGEQVWVHCKGKWVRGKTVAMLRHDFRIVAMESRCCFEHAGGTELLVPPTLYSFTRPADGPLELNGVAAE